MADSGAETVDLEAEELGSFQDSIPLAALTGHMNKTLVGNELAMQNRINLSIQLPRDDSSLLAIQSTMFPPC